MDEDNLVIPGGTDQELSVPFASDVRASAAAQTVNVDSGADVSIQGDDSDGVDLPGAISEYSVSASGNQITLERGDGTAATVSLNGAVDIGFDGGTATAQLDTSGDVPAVTLGGTTVDGGVDPGAVTLADTGGYLKKLATDPDQWLLSIAFFAGMGTILTVIGLWGVPYLVAVYGLDVTTASYYTLLGSVGILVGGPAVGRLSDRIGRRFPPLIAGFGLFVAVLLVIPIVGSPPLLVVAVLYFLIGCCLGVTMLALPIIKERYPTEASGVATAVVNGAGFFGATVLPTLMGFAVDRYRTGDVVAGTAVYTEFGYRVAFGITAGAVGIAFCSTLWLYVRQRRESNSPA